MFDIWDAEYGADKSKIVHIVAEWPGIPSEIETVMTYGQSVNHLADKADVIATGDYIGPFSVQWSPPIKSGRMTWEQVARMSTGEVTKAMNKSDRQGDRSAIQGGAGEEAQKWGLGLVVYEGGDGNEAGSA